MKITTEIFQSIRKKVAQNRLWEAMRLITEVCSRSCPEYRNFAVVLSRDLVNIKEESILGTADPEQHQRAERNITRRMLELTDLLENSVDLPQSSGFFPWLRRVSKWL